MMVPLFILLLAAQFSASAQTEKNDIYVDYKEMLDHILPNLKSASSKVPFTGSAELRKQTLTLSAGARAAVSSLVKAGNKEWSGAKILKERENGVLMICKYFKGIPGKAENIQLYATATALTTDGICVSNWHVFMNFIQPEGSIYATDSITFAVNLKGDIFPIEKVLAYSKDADAAIFKIGMGKKELSPIPLGPELEVGETVYTLGNPEPYLYYFSKGMVARNTADHKIGPMANRMEITADYAKGSSGGPILDDKGNMAGMVSSTFSIYAQDRPQANLQMVVKTTVPVGSIRRLLQLP